MSAEITDLIRNRNVLATGVLKFTKPYYIRDKRTGWTIPIAYVLSIKTAHTIEANGLRLPIFVSAWGKYSSWFYFRKLRKNNELIGVSGFRKSNVVYKGVYWVILERRPSPIIWYVGGSNVRIE